MTGWLLDATTLVVALAIAAALYPPLIQALRRRRFGQVIQDELEFHKSKAGTPTGGGILFVGLAVLGGLLATLAGHPGALPAVVGLVVGGVLGAFDDARKLRVGSIGLSARLKFPLQLLLAVPVAWLAHAPQHLPFDLGWWYWPLAIIAVVGTANAVNITDGSDGLAGGLLAIAVVTLALALPGAPAGERAVAMTLVGGILAFLVYNRFPARVFMGDAGSLGAGYALAAMAIQEGYGVLLPLLGLVFAVETLSVIIQVAYFRATGGRRVFKMTPIHHTFRIEGWSENRIALSFWGVGALSALATAGLARLSV
ncbi:MAG TPA: phospho-N-acetylmuramoyl-pentapeptide-transferase [Candidatus Dormibacteraeota bacterium]